MQDKLLIPYTLQYPPMYLIQYIYYDIYNTHMQPEGFIILPVSHSFRGCFAQGEFWLALKTADVHASYILLTWVITAELGADKYTVSSLQPRMKTLIFLVVVGTYSTAAGKQAQSVCLMALNPRCFQSFHVYFQKTLRRAQRRNGIDRCGSWHPVHTRDASLLISTRSLLLFLLSLWDPRRGVK